MNAKKTVAKFIRPNWIPLAISFLIPIVNFFTLITFFTTTLPALIRANKTLKKLQQKNILEQVAADLLNTNSKRFMKGKVVMSDNYVICKNTGYVFTYDEIVWAYRTRQSTAFLEIEFNVADSLYLATADKNPVPVALIHKDKNNEVTNAIVEIYTHNQCLVGYTNESLAKYKALRKR